VPTFRNVPRRPAKRARGEPIDRETHITKERGATTRGKALSVEKGRGSGEITRGQEGPRFRRYASNVHRGERIGWDDLAEERF